MKTNSLTNEYWIDETQDSVLIPQDLLLKVSLKNYPTAVPAFQFFELQFKCPDALNSFQILTQVPTTQLTYDVSAAGAQSYTGLKVNYKPWACFIQNSHLMDETGAEASFAPS